MKTVHRHPGQAARSRRSGLAALDYMLVLGIIMPLALIVIPNGKRMMQLVYEMMTVMVSWPFM